MSIVNRRNAMLGWLTWEAGKRIAAQKARSAVQADEGMSKKMKGLIVTLLAAAGAAVFFWRRNAADEAPQDAE
jgi:hypothetical protein